MPQGLEFIAGLFVFGLGIACTAYAIRLGRRFANLWLALGLACQLVILTTIAADWGYSAVDVSPYRIAIDRNIWILLPHIFSALCLSLPVTYPSSLPYLVVLSAGQACSFMLVFELVSVDIDTSFLSLYPILSVYLSLFSSFLFLARSLYHIPKEGSRWYSVAFGNRLCLLQAILSLKDFGFSTTPPETIVDSGSACGTIGSSKVFVTTKMRLFPPAHGLQINWSSPKKLLSSPPAPPPPLQNGTFKFSEDTASFQYFFRELKGLSGRDFYSFLESIAAQ